MTKLFLNSEKWRPNATHRHRPLGRDVVGRTLLALLVGLTAPIPGIAQSTDLPPISNGRGFLYGCTYVPPKGEAMLKCVIYLDGLMAGVVALERDIVGGPICFPQTATLTDVDVKFVEYLRTMTGAAIDNPTPTLFVMGMKAAYPCREAASPSP